MTDGLCLQEDLSVDALYQASYAPKSTADTVFKCDYHGCEKEYVLRKSLRKHQRTKHAEWYYGSRLEEKDELTIDSSTVHKPSKLMHASNGETADKDSVFYCNFDECTLSFSERIVLVKHRETEHNFYDVHMCDFPGCNRRFVHRQSMYRHQREQHTAWVIENKGKMKPFKPESPAIKRFSCSFTDCASTFTTRSSLRRHLRRFHRNSEELTLDEDEEEEDIEGEEEEEDDEDDEGMETVDGGLKVTADGGTLELESCQNDGVDDNVDEDSHDVMDLGALDEEL